MSEQPPVTPYESMGGEAEVYQLVTRFYEVMDSLPVSTSIRKLHAEDLSDAREKLFKFLSGWLGGPDLFVQAYGHPRLRQRHFKFAIGDEEIAQWLWCMEQALVKTPLEPTLKAQIWQAITQLALHMKNQA